MKTRVSILFVGVSLLALAACQTAPATQEAVAESQATNEEAALIATIEGEMRAYAERDYEAWSNYWIHDESAAHLGASKTGYRDLIGWDTINTQFQPAFESEPGSSSAKTENHIVRIDGSLASVTTEIRSDSGELDVRQVWTLSKTNGEWKIVQLVGIRVGSYMSEDGE